MPSAPARAHVIVLAAGRGSRLGLRGDETPKWLLEVGGRPIADRHLEGVSLACEVASIRVVTGHAADAIERYLAGRPEDVETVHVPEYAVRNNWWSLLSALRTVPGEGPIVVVNADLFVDPQALAGFIDAAVRGEPDGLLAADLVSATTDESMKVALSPAGTLEAIGKAGIESPAGEYIGILMARGTVLRDLRAALEAFEPDPADHNQWYEGAVGRTAAAGARWHLWALPGADWVEIDDDVDLDAAESLAAG